MLGSMDQNAADTRVRKNLEQALKTDHSLNLAIHHSLIKDKAAENQSTASVQRQDPMDLNQFEASASVDVCDNMNWHIAVIIVVVVVCLCVDVQVLGVLGAGAFGKVSLCRRQVVLNATLQSTQVVQEPAQTKSALYAIKSISSQHMVRRHSFDSEQTHNL